MSKIVIFQRKGKLEPSNVLITSETYLRKLQGSTAVALYGLGNIRDERLSRMFQVCSQKIFFHAVHLWNSLCSLMDVAYYLFLLQTPHAVQWMRPESQEGCQVSDWFNILVLHQNRFVPSCVFDIFKRFHQILCFMVRC